MLFAFRFTQSDCRLKFDCTSRFHLNRFLGQDCIAESFSASVPVYGFVFQFQAQASDQRGIFEKTGSATVLIRIRRSSAYVPPQFESGSPYRDYVHENAAVNSTVFTVRATSADPTVSLCIWHIS